VYRFTFSRPTWEQRALAALLRLGPAAALSHDSAAFVLRLKGFASRPESVEVLVPHGFPRVSRAHPLMPGVVLHRARAPFESFKVGGLRVTDARRTLLDLAGRLQGDRLDAALDAAHRYDEDLAARLTKAVEGRKARVRGVKGIAGLRELLADRDGRATESPLEAEVFRALRRADLPRPVHQYEVTDEGGYVTRLDFAWPEERVALHVDGYAYHHDRVPFEHDRLVGTRLTALGWRSVWVTSRSKDDTTWLRAVQKALGLGASEPCATAP
jgi:hypothetical protein